MFEKLKNVLNLERWIENFEGYLDARIELMKYDVKETLVEVLTKSVFVLGMAVFGLAALVCLNFGLAHLLNALLGNEWAGFLILAGFYFLLTLGFYLSRDNASLNEKMEARFREALKQPRADSTPENPEADA